MRLYAFQSFLHHKGCECQCALGLMMLTLNSYLRECLSVYLWKVISFLWINKAYVGKYFSTIYLFFPSSTISLYLPSPTMWTLVPKKINVFTHLRYSSTQAIQYQKHHLIVTCGKSLVTKRSSRLLWFFIPTSLSY